MVHPSIRKKLLLDVFGFICSCQACETDTDDDEYKRFLVKKLDVDQLRLSREARIFSTENFIRETECYKAMIQISTKKRADLGYIVNTLLVEGMHVLNDGYRYSQTRKDWVNVKYFKDTANDFIDLAKRLMVICQGDYK